VKSKERMMAETLYKSLCKGVELENLEEAANNHQTVLKNVPFPR
jgi:hypothetical protein